MSVVAGRALLPVRSLFIVYRKLHEISLDEAVYLAVHHSVNVSCLIVCAVVFHTPVVKHVTADLASPLYLLLSSLNLRLRLESLLHRAVV